MSGFRQGVRVLTPDGKVGTVIAPVGGTFQEDDADGVLVEDAEGRQRVFDEDDLAEELKG